MTTTTTTCPCDGNPFDPCASCSLTIEHNRNGGCDFCTKCVGCGTYLCPNLGGGVLDEIRIPATGEMATVMFCTPCGTPTGHR